MDAGSMGHRTNFAASNDSDKAKTGIMHRIWVSRTGILHFDWIGTGFPARIAGLPFPFSVSLSRDHR